MSVLFITFLLFSIVYSDDDINPESPANGTFYDQINEADRANFIKLQIAKALNNRGNLQKNISIPSDLDIPYETFNSLELIEVPDDFEENLLNWTGANFNLSLTELQKIATSPAPCVQDDDDDNNYTSSTDSAVTNNTKPGGNSPDNNGNAVDDNGNSTDENGKSVDDNGNSTEENGNDTNENGSSAGDNSNGVDDNNSSADDCSNGGDDGSNFKNSTNSTNSTNTTNRPNSTNKANSTNRPNNVNSAETCVTSDDIAALCCPFA